MELGVKMLMNRMLKIKKIKNYKKLMNKNPFLNLRFHKKSFNKNQIHNNFYKNKINRTIIMKYKITYRLNL